MAITVVQGGSKDLIDVRMKRHAIGPGGVPLFRDQEYALPASDAAYMVYAGQCEEIGEDIDTETAQEKYDRLQLEAAQLARQGKRRSSPQAPIEAHDGSGAVPAAGAVAGGKSALTTIGTETK